MAEPGLGNRGTTSARCILEQHIFQTPKSFHALIPSELPPEFTSLDFAKASGESRRLAQKAVYCLAEDGYHQASWQTQPVKFVHSS